MTEQEKEFVESWGTKRQIWNWGTNFKRTVIYAVLPLVLLIDLVNFFIIGDIAYGFISFTHLGSLAFNFVILSILIGFLYNLIIWNTNEMRYWAIIKKNKRNNRT